MSTKTTAGSEPSTMTRRTHPQFEGPIGNPRAGKRATHSFRGGWHREAIGPSDSHAVKSLTGNPHK
jgi:hypothetical protein